MTDDEINEVRDLKVRIIRLCRDGKRDFHPQGLGEVAMLELISEGYIMRGLNETYELTEKGERV